MFNFFLTLPIVYFNSIFKGCSGGGTSTNNESRCDSMSSLGGGLHEPGCPSAQGSQGSRHLLDDSEIDPPGLSSPQNTLSRTM